METDEEAETAQRALDGMEFDGRRLRVNPAQPRAGGRERRSYSDSRY